MWCMYTYTHIHSYTIRCYSAIKTNAILPFATTWMDLEGIMLSEVSQRKLNAVVITYMWNLKNKWMIIAKQEQTNRYREQTN